MKGYGYEQTMEGHGSNAHERNVEGNEINTNKVTSNERKIAEHRKKSRIEKKHKHPRGNFHTRNG